jgi:thiamine biosynthesis lipoprotein
MACTRIEHVMGMPVIVDVRDEDVSEGALDPFYAWLRVVDATFSTYRADSDVCRIDRRELDPEDAEPEVREILARCDDLRRETGGYFDARSAGPARFDPSGLVKGWSIERGSRILDRLGARNYAVNAGGDILVKGGELPSARWRVGIRHPVHADAVAAVLDVTDLAVATSGAYERGNHVLDPFTRRPPRGVLSVTVVGPDLGTADAYATAAFAMGPRGAHWTARLPRGYDAMTILEDRTVLSTPGFPREAGLAA